jgi:hypothetical protein
VLRRGSTQAIIDYSCYMLCSIRGVRLIGAPRSWFADTQAFARIPFDNEGSVSAALCHCMCVCVCVCVCYVMCVYVCIIVIL